MKCTVHSCLQKIEAAWRGHVDLQWIRKIHRTSKSYCTKAKRRKQLYLILALSQYYTQHAATYMGVGIAQWYSAGLVIGKSQARSQQKKWGKFLLQGQLSVLTLISVSAPPRHYHSRM